MVLKARRLSVKIAHGVLTLSTVSTFVILYLLFTRAQAAANLTAMQTQWFAAFPPFENPLSLLKWLVSVHTGSMFRIPPAEDGAGPDPAAPGRLGGRTIMVPGRKTDGAGLFPGPIQGSRWLAAAIGAILTAGPCHTVRLRASCNT